MKYLRPGETEFHKFLVPIVGDETRRTWSVEVEHVKALVTGWEGFTEATLFGADVGGDAVVEFSPDVWAAVIVDNAEWSGMIGRDILDSIVDYITKREENAKN